MKSVIILFIALFPLSIMAQTKINEKQAIEKKHLDFSKEYLFFELSGLIEIDGHTFQNDTCADPIIYEVDLYEIRIHDKSNSYTPRKCNKPGCKIIHFDKSVVGKSGIEWAPDNNYFQKQIVPGTLMPGTILRNWNY